MSKVSRRVRAAAFSVWLACFCVLPIAAHAGETGTVIVPRLNLRPEPGTAKPPVFTLKKGDIVQVLAHAEGWLNIRFEERTGWIIDKTSYVRLESDGDASSTDPEINRAQQQVADIRRKIRTGNAEVAAFSKKEADIVSSLDDIDFALNEARKRRKALELESTQLENKMAATALDIDMLAEEIDEGRAYASRRLVALYKLARVGRIHVLASAASIHELFQRQSLLERILDNDRRVLTQLAENQAKLQRLRDDQQSRVAAKASLAAALTGEIEEMARKRSRRKEILAEIQSKKTLQMAALENLKQSSDALSEKIKLLRLQTAQTEPTYILPSKPFGDLKGLLKMPVEGKIISTFGAHRSRRFNVVNFRGGIDIKADRGEPIRAVFAGKVVFADWFKGYGNMVIIDHGGGFHTVYANVEEYFIAVGDGVQTGEVVATVGDTGSVAGARLYFEIRRDSKPVDPMKWIAKG